MLEKIFAGIILAEETVPNWLVIVMGVGTVFVGLICIVIICSIVGLFFKNKKDKTAEEPKINSSAVCDTVIQNRQEIIAAVSAVIAEELGTDISAIRIHSFKKL